MKPSVLSLTEEVQGKMGRLVENLIKRFLKDAGPRIIPNYELEDS